MPVVGFRCFKDAVAFVVLDGTTDAPILREHQHVRIPAGHRGDQLVWVRREVIEVLERTSPTAIAFKAAESNARQQDPGRAEVEGVLQEAARATGLSPERRTLRGIKSDLGFEESARYLPRLLVGELTVAGNRREAALAALSALANA